VFRLQSFEEQCTPSSEWTRQHAQSGYDHLRSNDKVHTLCVFYGISARLRAAIEEELLHSKLGYMEWFLPTLARMKGMKRAVIYHPLSGQLRSPVCPASPEKYSRAAGGTFSCCDKTAGQWIQDWESTKECRTPHLLHPVKDHESLK
jgi:hypothetical protein